MRRMITLLVGATLMVSPALAENIQSGSGMAWGENVGWLNPEPLGDGGPGMQVDDFELTGWIWGENIGWVSLSCKNTDSCHVVDYGVRQDGMGNLNGFAWAENAGWINLSCATTGSCGSNPFGVTIDPATGAFLGDAWGENIGWVRFGSTGPVPFEVVTEWRCLPLPPLPAGTPFLTLEPIGPETLLQWAPNPGSSAWDVVFGEIQALRLDPNHFAAATLGCIAENQTDPVAVFPGEPPPGDGFWFLVRGVNCAGAGTQDTGEPSQPWLRDPEIAASGNDCS